MGVPVVGVGLKRAMDWRATKAEEAAAAKDRDCK